MYQPSAEPPASPIDGRVGRTLVTLGNLVGCNEPTLLTTVVRLDPVHVCFESSEREFLKYQELIRARAAAPAIVSGLRRARPGTQVQVRELPPGQAAEGPPHPASPITTTDKPRGSTRGAPNPGTGHDVGPAKGGSQSQAPGSFLL